MGEEECNEGQDTQAMENKGGEEAGHHGPNPRTGIEKNTSGDRLLNPFRYLKDRLHRLD